MDIKRLHVGPALSETAIYNGTVYLAGQIAEDTTQGMLGQTKEVLAHIDSLLIEAGSDKTRILSCQIFIANAEDFNGMNEAWNAWVPAGQTPPRATVVVSFPHPQRLIEIIVIAAVN